MKARLNLTIDEEVLVTMKLYASKAQLSLSEMVETYFKKASGSSKKTSILDLIDKRGKRKFNFDVNADLKKLYYEERAKKYGF